MIPFIGPTGNYICPYCGRTLNVYRAGLTKDHIVPRSFWALVQSDSSKFKRIKKDNAGLPSTNDDRNIMLVCAICNMSKSNTLAVPSWSICGRFRYWDIKHLQSYAEYFYYWSDCFLEYLEETIRLYYDPEFDILSVVQAKRNISDIEKFKEEYKERYETNSWFIGG